MRNRNRNSVRGNRSLRSRASRHEFHRVLRIPDALRKRLIGGGVCCRSDAASCAKYAGHVCTRCDVGLTRRSAWCGCAWCGSGNAERLCARVLRSWRHGPVPAGGYGSEERQTAERFSQKRHHERLARTRRANNAVYLLEGRPYLPIAKHVQIVSIIFTIHFAYP